MRLLPIIFCAFLLCSCASGKPQYIPPPKVVEPEEVVPEVVAAETIENNGSIETVKTYAEDSFLAILIAEGTPTENFIPRSKEQVAVYHKGDIYRFYYFKHNRLVMKKDYPAANVELMKAADNYPRVILQEIGAIQ